MRKIEWSNYLAQSLTCAGRLTILILFALATACRQAQRLPTQRGHANGISTSSVSPNHSNTDEIDWTKPTLCLTAGCRQREQQSISKNPQQPCSNIPAAKSVTRTELFFGLRKPNGTEVNNAEFQRFLVGGASPVENREVTPRFPDGFTVISGRGQFKDARGAILQERSKLLILLYPIAASSNQQIEQIRKAYITAFQQQSVLRADNQSCAAF